MGKKNENEVTFRTDRERERAFDKRGERDVGGSNHIESFQSWREPPGTHIQRSLRIVSRELASNRNHIRHIYTYYSTNISSPHILGIFVQYISLLIVTVLAEIETRDVTSV